MSEEEIKEMFENIDRRLMIHQAIKEPISKDLDNLIKLSLAYEELKQENTNLKQTLEKIRKYIKSTGLYETNINPDEPNIYNLELVRINDKLLQILDKGVDK